MYGPSLLATSHKTTSIFLALAQTKRWKKCSRDLNDPPSKWHRSANVNWFFFVPSPILHQGDVPHGLANESVSCVPLCLLAAAKLKIRQRGSNRIWVMFFDAHCVGRVSAALAVTAATTSAAGYSQWMRETTNLWSLSFELLSFELFLF